MIDTTTLSRRRFLGATLTGAALPLAASPLLAPTQVRAQGDGFVASLRSTLDVTRYGVRPGALDDQSIAFQEAINRAAADGQALFLPGGDYVASNVDLPSGLTLIGVPGQTRIRYAGDGHLFFATGVENLHLEGLTLDGGNRPLADYAPALLHISTGSSITLDGLTVLGSLKDGVRLDRFQGRVERCTLTGIMGAALVSNDARGLAIRDNVVTDCADNGILVHRWEKGRDGTLVSGNRIERIGAKSDGTGPFGNGINAFRADDVMISGNILSDATFSAIRCNACSNVQIIGNQCRQLGEVAISAAFGFQGAVVANNIVDGAASGVAIANFLDGGRMAVVQGNIIRNMTMQGRTPFGEPAYGTGIYVEADTTVTGNVLEDAPFGGIRVGWGPSLRNVIVSQNIIRRAQAGVMVSLVDGVGPSVIKDNMFEDTPEGAVVGARWWETVTGDLTEARDVPAPLTVEGNQTLS
ncbi:MAG: TIGR03808 family TAT-translocated repetitive protein [Devosiaceae bacterium]|nr:TIGR03808 family TAT-translocated repetitive protein [Devosiaceae bacterium MH13]